jgi:hypothetical protein
MAKGRKWRMARVEKGVVDRLYKTFWALMGTFNFIQYF